MKNFALADIGGEIVDGWKHRNSEDGVLTDAQKVFKLEGYFKRDEMRGALKKRNLEVRKLDK